MMPSVDHCLNKSGEMTTLSNSLEVFDTYKHRDDKDSDEESFHLPLDDDESESKYQDAVVKNGTGPESEDEILNKFESATTTVEPIDSHLEDRLLNDEEEEEKSNEIKENGTHKVGHNTVESCVEEGTDKPTSKTDPVNGIINEANCKENDVVPSKDQVPNVDVDTAEKDPTDKSPSQAKTHVDVDKCDSKTSSNESKSRLSHVNNTAANGPKAVENQSPSGDGGEGDSSLSRSEVDNSNDSTKSQTEDNEDLFDISIIRDAEEDNAESAYNEAHPEDSHNEEDEERPEEECNSTNHLEEEEEEDEDMDMDKHEDHLKNDDVDIEETKLDCDGESDSGNKTDLDQSGKEQVQNTSGAVKGDGASKARLDEVTGNLIDGDSVQIIAKKVTTSDGGVGKAKDADSEDSEKRKSLKRTLSDEAESSATKKSRTYSEQTDAEQKEPDKPKEKLPLRTLLSLSEFMKSRKSNKRLTMQDLEEFCLQKICEVIVHKSDLGDVHHQLKLQEQLIEAMRKEIQQLTKQARDLEIVNKKLLNDLKQQTATQKPLNPLKITRSVGLQVKFTPAFDANMKRRQQNPALAGQKIQVQTPTPSRGPRNIPLLGGPAARQVDTVGKTVSFFIPPFQVATPQKQPQQPPPLVKPNTPLLSQALQTRRAAAPSEASVNKTTPAMVRPKQAETKSANPSASVIDLTDEDDKKDKNKMIAPKVIQKSIAVPLRTTPMRVNAAQGIRLTTSQGKVAPITTMVTSSTTPQVMYVVQSSPQNLTSPLGPKAVVVNFQSPNGVISSTLNGSAVSVIPKQGNTIQLKTMTPQKSLGGNKVVKMANKHPAPLPSPPLVRISSEKPLKPIPPKPHLTIRKTETGIILQWKMPYELDAYEVIASYQLYAYQETSAMPSTDMWRKVGDVKALALPMACTLTQFADKNKYYFAVRPVDIHKRIGVFSEPEEISL